MKKSMDIKSEMLEELIEMLSGMDDPMMSEIPEELEELEGVEKIDDLEDDEEKKRKKLAMMAIISPKGE